MPDVSLYMPLHIGDWLRSTLGMSAIERGAHIGLLVAAWQNGGKLRDDVEFISRLSGVEREMWPSVWATLSPLWPLENGFRVAPGMAEAIARAQKARNAAIARGKAGGKAPHPTQRKPENRDEVELNSKPSGDEREHPNSELRRSGDPPIVPQGGQNELKLEPDRDQVGGTEAEAIRAVFAHYRTHHPRACPRPVSKSEEWRKIKARLAEGSTVADLCKAIDGYHKHKWHVENGQIGLELIVRNASNVAQGIGWAEECRRSPPAQSPGKVQPTLKLAPDKLKRIANYAAEAAADANQAGARERDGPPEGDVEALKRDLTKHVTPPTAA